MFGDLFRTQQEYINAFFNRFDIDNADQVLREFASCKGIIIFVGVGKSGIIAKKIATTLTSTGTKALCISPTDALHGDIGIVTEDDIMVMISKSGETDELLSLVPYARNKGVHLIALVSNPDSRLAKACHHVVNLPLQKELCPYDLAPTTSAILQLIFGDVMAVALMKMKEFSLDQYAKNHPAGRIGKRIILRVSDLMITGEGMPRCYPEELLGDTIVELSNKRCGCLIVTDHDDALLGIFTDGDLRRALQRHKSSLITKPLGELMTPNPHWISANTLAWDAVQTMEADQNHPVMVLPVLDDITHRLVGIIKMHDLVQSGLVSLNHAPVSQPEPALSGCS